MLLHYALQGIWLASTIPNTLDFHRASKGSLERVQTRVLREILARNAETRYGRKFGFGSIRNARTFAERVPIVDHEDIRGEIGRMAAGERAVLSADPVRLFEKSSGSTSATKLIPYTAPLQESFARALHPWVCDLYSHLPMIWGGPSYWVITPRYSDREKTVGGVPVGFSDDVEYFGGRVSAVLDRMMAVPGTVGRISSIDAWRYCSLLSLLRTTDLRLISLWHPSFLTVLFSHLDEFRQRLAADIRHGTCDGMPGSEMSPVEIGSIKAAMAAPPKPERADQIAALPPSAFRSPGFGREIWPKVALISTWTHGSAAEGTGELKASFPGVTIQGKGLLATEGVVSFPILGSPAPVLAALSGFFEFEKAEPDLREEVVPAWELTSGKTYRVIVTTPGGLYRYRLHDRIRVDGMWRNLPCLTFLGKEGFVSDLRGEKLNSSHVEKTLLKILGKERMGFLAPESPSAAPPRYVLFFPGPRSGSAPGELAAALESGLKENFHYSWCRETGQLAHSEVLSVDLSPENFRESVMERFTREFRTISTMKLLALVRSSGWREWFAGKNAR